MTEVGHADAEVRGAARATMETDDVDVDRSIEHHTGRTLWLLSVVGLLGVWMIVAPWTFGYGDPGQAATGAADATSTRRLSPIATRGQWMTWSDIASGVALVVLAVLSVNARRYWSRWAACLVGVWLIPLAVDEVAAMVQFVARKRREGAGLWHTFWYGDTVEGGGTDDRTPHYPTTVGRAVQASAWGMTMPTTLLASTAVGLWLMAAPAVLGTTGAAADSDHMVGALVVCVAVVAMAEIARALRFLNVAFGMCLIAAPLLVDGGAGAYAASSVACGVALVALSLPRGVVLEQYGTLDRLVR